MELKVFTDEELNAELRRRREEERIKQIPKPLEVINIDPLKSVCVAHIKEISMGLDNVDVADEDIYEAAMEVIFGPEVWDWISINK